MWGLAAKPSHIILKKIWSILLKKVITFQVIALFLVIAIWIQGPLENYPEWLKSYMLPANCILLSTLGGILYCLRSIYLERCVNKSWDPDWEAWYYLRPIASSISGLIAYIFLKAGLVVLEADQEIESENFGFLALAFIAGLNVNNFVQKIEEIAKSTFGIENSRTSAKDK